MKRNIELSFVPYEIAILLKEIKFNEPCIAAYQINNDKIEVTKGYNEFDFTPIFCLGDNIEIKKLHYPTPTWTQIFDWFRDKHKLHITITTVSQDSFQYHIQKPGEPLGKIVDKDYDDVFDANANAVIECIKIIKHKKYIEKQLYPYIDNGLLYDEVSKEVIKFKEFVLTSSTDKPYNSALEQVLKDDNLKLVLRPIEDIDKPIQHKDGTSVAKDLLSSSLQMMIDVFNLPPTNDLRVYDYELLVEMNFDVFNILNTDKGINFNKVIK